MTDVTDLAGMNRSVVLQDHSIRAGEAFLLVYSICSRASFEAISKLHKRILQVKGQSSEGAVFPIPIVVVGNQMDRTTEREVSPEEGRALASALGCGFIETSAKHGSSVEAAFLGVVEQLVRQRSIQGSQGKTSPPRRTSGCQRSSLLTFTLPWRWSQKRDKSSVMSGSAGLSTARQDGNSL